MSSNKLTVAMSVYAHRAAGQSDPTENLPELPGCETFGMLFNDPDPSMRVYNEMFRGLSHFKIAMHSDLFQELLRHIRNGGEKRNHRRTAARPAIRMNQPVRILRLAGAMITS